MTVNFSTRNQVWFVCAVLGLLLGCEAKTPTSAPVQADKAREALTVALDSWKAGEAIELVQSKPPLFVTVQDFDWMGGAKLIDYEVVGDGTPMDANLKVEVKLKLEGSDGKSSEKTVNYLVGTAPEVTVFRDAMP